MTEKKSLTARQHRAISLLVQGGLTNQAIAKRVGVSERTLRRWKVDPVFRAEKESLRQRVRDDAVDELAGMLHLATRNLRDILSGKVKPVHGMLRAIELALHESRVSEEAEIRSALAELKEVVEGRS